MNKRRELLLLVLVTLIAWFAFGVLEFLVLLFETPCLQFGVLEPDPSGPCGKFVLAALAGFLLFPILFFVSVRRHFPPVREQIRLLVWKASIAFSLVGVLAFGRHSIRERYAEGARVRDNIYTMVLEGGGVDKAEYVVSSKELLVLLGYLSDEVAANDWSAVGGAAFAATMLAMSVLGFLQSRKTPNNG